MRLRLLTLFVVRLKNKTMLEQVRVKRPHDLVLMIHNIIRRYHVVFVSHGSAPGQINRQASPDAIADLRISDADKCFNCAINPARLIVMIVNPCPVPESQVIATIS